ncbi:Sec2p-domain-containing protein [Delitschia confertaspora ATCC 74209]|uniref:Sec2p-domain-containing protein n=1 Tax=Delitschia confertaspora ATCC 74209 TaxID=1513339 RepID=A0A9P4JG58_9PLEO|nr:Sec2p-domain-containing protein [Delitschia confertaspora ATCC 74209]
MNVQAHLRSLSPTPKTRHTRALSKSTSTPHLGKMATVMTSPPQPPALFRTESEMNTIPDPRSNTPLSTLSRNGSTDSSMHPDLSQEVATLSTKLINAINYQTTLDDSLQQTRHELEKARERLVELEAAAKEHERMIQQGLLVEKEVYNKMEKQLLSELAEEKKRRIEAEKAKRKVDGEVEALTSALFEEANEMVAAARKDAEASEKRSEQLKHQLNDSELLLASQQEQLQDLKAVMQQMSERGDNDTNTYSTTAPSTPGLVPVDKISKLFEAANLTPNTPGSDDVPPDHPLHFSHLIHPVLRSDLPAFKDFQEMFKINIQSSAPPSRAASGNYSGLNVLGLAALSNGSTTSLPPLQKSTSVSSSTSSPRGSLSSPSSPAHLKDEKFYKRSLTEDIEPTLRLDIAPGLSWMARRTVLNSIAAGSLVVEPHPPPPKFRGPVFPCALCGESRKGDKYARKFRFKTSETDEAQKYPLCDYCLARLRTTCDYMAFLRMVAAGHWRAESEEEKKSAWEESIRLRERMFWARIGGGVVPAFVPLRESPRSPSFANGNGKDTRTSEESVISERALDSSEKSETKTEEGKEYDPFRSDRPGEVKRVSIGKTVISAEPDGSSPQEEQKTEDAAAEQPRDPVEDILVKKRSDEPKTESNTSKESQHQRSASTPYSSEKPPASNSRLSLAIPGSFY